MITESISSSHSLYCEYGGVWGWGHGGRGRQRLHLGGHPPELRKEKRGENRGPSLQELPRMFSCIK